MVKQGVLAVNPWEEASGLDPEAVHNALQDLERYRGFAQAVRDYLESTGALED